MSAELPLRLSLFGHFRLDRGGAVIRLPTRKTETLLAYLALHPGPNPREILAALFWGDAPPERANGSLRTALNALRRVLGPRLLAADRFHVELLPGAELWVDVREFDSAIRPQADLAAGARALDLYTGDLLASAYDEWLGPLREHYRQAFVEHLLRQAEALRANSQYPQAVAAAERVLTLEPHNERAHQHLIFCRLAAGQRDAALAQFERLAAGLRAEHGATPLPETTALYHWIKQTPVARRSPAALRTNLPLPLSSFVGRAADLAAIRQWLAPTTAPIAERAGQGLDELRSPSARLLTLTGPGGSGKTRLAIQAALELVDAYPDGLWWVELGALAEPAFVAHAVANALGVREPPSRPVDQALVEHLQPRSLLLLLDNCEHLLDACARVVGGLLAAAPRLVILATSREPLGLPGETIWPVRSLAGPAGAPSATAVAASEAGRLFLDRAQSVRPDFALSDHNAPEVAEICRRLDGLPLALELAAAQAIAFSTSQIAARLADRFESLSGGSRAALPRHQTLRAALAWSLDLLSADERAFLGGLSVFAGGFDLYAVEAVAAPTHAAAGLLERLVRKSLVVAEHPPEGAARYYLLETIRAFARAELEDSGQALTYGDRHLAHYTGLAARAASALRTGQQAAALDELEAAHDNLLAALDFAEQNPSRGEAGLALAGLLWRFWWSRGRYQLGRARLEQALARPAASAPSVGRAQALLGLGGLLHVHGSYAAAADVLAEADDLFERFGLEADRAAALVMLGVGAHETGQNARALTLLAQALELAARAGDVHTQANALNNIGHVLLEEDRLDEAVSHVERAAAAWRAVGNEQSLAYCLHNLGEIARRRGDFAGARRWHEQALAIRRRLSDWPRVGWSLFALGRVVYEQGALAEAEAILDEGLAVFDELDDRPGMAHVCLIAGRVAQRLERLASAARSFAHSLRLFHDLGLEQGAAESLAGLAALAAAEGRAERAARLLGAVNAWIQRLPAALPPAEARILGFAADVARAALQPAVFDAAWADGQALAADGHAAVVAYALDLYS